MKIILIGQGNVACNMHAAFLRSEQDVRMVSSRQGLEDLPMADVYIYAVRDDALADVVRQVHRPTALHLHTSGSMTLSVFGEDQPHAGILYPFMTFTKSHLLPDFSIVPLFIESRQKDDLPAITGLAHILSPSVYPANEYDRALLHLAGVFTNNFSNQMCAIAANLLEQAHLPFQVLLPIMDETVHKLHTLSPYDAQTGPARRGDKNILKKHESLITDPRDLLIYQLLSERIRSQYPSAPL